MIVYHGSNVVVNHPDTEHSFRSLDFGKGNPSIRVPLNLWLY